MQYRVVAGFGATEGYETLDALAEGPDGAFYGTTDSGGPAGVGTVFRITPAGVYMQLYGFTGGADGGQPRAGLTLAADGNFYGMTSRGGEYDAGTVFRLTPAGVLTRIYSFQVTEDGGYPEYRLILGADGFLYGATPVGGSDAGAGTLFRISTSGVLTVLHMFGGIHGDGSAPHALTQTPDGQLYGTAGLGPGGLTSHGMVFRYASDGLMVLHNFDGSDGAAPNAQLALGSDGRLYGTTRGATGTGDVLGTVFSVDPVTGDFRIEHRFSGLDGSSPLVGPVRATDGSLYGVARGGSYDGVVFSLAPGGAFTVLHDFGQNDPACSCYSDGILPSGTLIQGSDGWLYGSTISGGPGQSGTLFALSTAGAFEKLHDFSARPLLPLDITRIQSGDLVGPTYDVSNGGLYRVDLAGSVTTLHLFNGEDGSMPVGPLVEAPDDTLYGITRGGGQPDASGVRHGTVFRVSGGLVSTLHSFDSAATPPLTVTLGTDGYLYGASGAGPEGYGTAFRLDRDTGGFTTLHEFRSEEGGPPVSLVEAVDGTIYGITLYGGTTGHGTVFQMDVLGNVTVLCEIPVALGGTVTLLRGTDGLLYGAASSGGTNGSGILFRVDPAGIFTTTHEFSGPDGTSPLGGLVEGPEGRLYGTANAGGALGQGVVFRMWPDGSGFELVHDFTGPDDARPAGQMVQDTNHNFYGLASRVAFELSFAPLSVQVGAPGAGENLTNNVGYSVQWTASGGVGDQRSFDVLLSTDGGATFSGIPGCANLLGSTRSCAWTPLVPATSQAVVEVIARDFGNNTARAFSAVFSITGELRSSTSTSLVTSPNPSHQGEGVTLTATLTPLIGSGDTIAFFDGTIQLGTASTDSHGMAQLVTLALTEGTHSLTASYAGATYPNGGGWLPSVSVPVVQTVQALLVPNVALSSTSLDFGTLQVLQSTMAPNPTAVGELPNDVAIGDLNGDGKLDVAVVDGGLFQQPGALTVLLGDGAGGLRRAGDYEAGVEASGIALADVNHDGALDVVTGSQRDSAATLFLGHGDGTFSPGTTVPIGKQSFSVAIGDINQDGNPDIVTTFLTGSAILVGNGDGTFAEPLLIDGAEDLAITDVDDDTVPDLVVGCSWYRGNGDGSFASGVSVGVPCLLGVAAADLNHDGIEDLAFANRGGSNVWVLYGTGGGHFTIPVSLSVGRAPWKIRAADLDGDGLPELIVTHDLLGSVAVLHNRGGAFDPAVFYGFDPFAEGFAVGDLDGDGHPDVVTSLLLSNGVRLLMNRGDGSLRSAQAVLMRNLGTANLHYTSATIIGPDADSFFIDTNTCGGQGILDVGGYGCTITVGFGPRTAGSKAATLRIIDDSSTSPHDISLTGIASPVANTPSGSNVGVAPIDSLTGGTPISLTFANVTSAGSTTLATSSSGPPPPSGFKIGNPPVYYDLETTATYSGAITLCINYSAISYANVNHLKLFHYERGAWVDRTSSLNVAASTICATVSSLSPFAVFETSYTFGGFFAPVANLPTFNTVKAGAAIPLKFSLAGYFGLGVVQAGFPQSLQVLCDSGSKVDVSDETVTAGSSSLSYDTTAGQYIYVWKTNKVWADTCRQLKIALDDGSVHEVLFSFNK